MSWSATGIVRDPLTGKAIVSQPLVKTYRLDTFAVGPTANAAVTGVVTLTGLTDGVQYAAFADVREGRHIYVPLLVVVTGMGSGNWAGTSDLADIAAAEAAGSVAKWPYADHVHAHGSGYLPNAHHNQSHVLATNTALGADHTISGTAANQALFASSSSAANFRAIATGDLPANIPVSQLRQYEFIAFNANTTSNQTGDGTDYTVPFDSEVTDDGGNFASNTFTAPIGGCYQLNCAVSIAALGAAHTQALLTIVTSNRTYRFGRMSVGAARDNLNAIILGGSVLADMDASDTATVHLSVSNSTPTVGVEGNASVLLTFFSGFLAA